jgi:hypothetical protein
VDLQPRMTGDGTGWYAHVVVMRHEEGLLLLVPLSLKRATVFPTIKDANAAGMALARAWIDREEGETP